MVSMGCVMFRCNTILLWQNLFTWGLIQRFKLITYVIQAGTLQLISSSKSSALLLELFSPINIMCYSNLPCCTQLLNYKEELETERGKASLSVICWLSSQCVQGLFCSASGFYQSDGSRTMQTVRCDCYRCKTLLRGIDFSTVPKANNTQGTQILLCMVWKE